MSCKISLEKLDDTMKQLAEQQKALANDIKLKDLEIAQSKESYMKVLGAIEIVEFLKKEVQHSAAEDGNIDITEAT
jgi:predicted HAD superfamily hydrolase|tara:strand:+ start:417 stop:644 length:228 start_codon:yes stop_codon:yes gene_type:complete